MKTISELIAQLKAEPGKGKGVGLPPREAGGTDNCVCPSCGAVVEHPRGKPCNQIHCPKCKVPMQGST